MSVGSRGDRLREPDGYLSRRSGTEILAVLLNCTVGGGVSPGNALYGDSPTQKK